MKDLHHEMINATERTHWWYRVRRRMVHDIIRRYFPHRSDLRILDVGCGTGELLTELSPYGNVEGLDVSPLAVDFAREKGLPNIEVGEAGEILRPDDSYDIVLALDVIEHIEDDTQALREIQRVLAPGGRAIIFVPAFMFLWGITDEQSLHYRRYTQGALAEKVMQAGFVIERSSYFNTFLFPAIAFVRLFSRIFAIKMETENTLGSSFNGVLFAIFFLESRLLRFVRFPFGVSVYMVARK